MAVSRCHGNECCLSVNKAPCLVQHGSEKRGSLLKTSLLPQKVSLFRTNCLTKPVKTKMAASSCQRKLPHRRRLLVESDGCLMSRKMNRKKEIYDLEEDCSGRRIFDVKSLVSGIEQAAVCKNRKEGSLLLHEDGRMGLASQMTFKCIECGEETSFNTDCRTGRFFPVNRSAVFASKLIGRGYVALTKICSTLDITGPMAKRGYEKHSKHIKDAAILEAKESMSAAVKEIREINN